MDKKFYSYVCLFVSLNFLFGCVKTYTPVLTTAIENSSGDLYIARKIPDVDIWTTTGKIQAPKNLSCLAPPSAGACLILQKLSIALECVE